MLGSAQLAGTAFEYGTFIGGSNVDNAFGVALMLTTFTLLVLPLIRFSNHPRRLDPSYGGLGEGLSPY